MFNTRTRNEARVFALRASSSSHEMRSPSKGLNDPSKGLNNPSKGLNNPSKGLNIPSKGLNNPSIDSDSDVYIPGFEIVKKDRRVNGRKGGGVCIYLRTNLNYRIRDDLITVRTLEP